MAWSINGALADAQFGYFGRPWTWTSSICAEWPGSDNDRYTGPFTRATANPVLVVGNRFDPATPYQRDEVAAGRAGRVDVGARRRRAELEAVAGVELVTVSPSWKRRRPSSTQIWWWTKV